MSEKYLNPSNDINRQAGTSEKTEELQRAGKEKEPVFKLRAGGLENPEYGQRAVNGKEPRDIKRAVHKKKTEKSLRADTQMKPNIYKRAVVFEKTDIPERAAANLKSEMRMRAGEGMETVEGKRAEGREETEALKRAVLSEETGSKERAGGVEKPEVMERAETEKSEKRQRPFYEESRKRTEEWEKRMVERFSSMKHPRLRILVETYYDYQKLRIASENRLRIYDRFGLLSEEQYAELKELCGMLKKSEGRIARLIAGEVKEVPVWDEWLSKVKGVGPVMAGGLIAFIDDISKARTVSSLWKYCVPKGTVIITRNGWKFVEEISPGDFVLSGDGRFHKVTETFVRPYNGELVRIKARYILPILLTPEHPILTANVKRIHVSNKPTRYNFKVEYIWKPASEVKVGDYLVVPVQKEVSVKDSLTINVNPKLNERRTLRLDGGLAYILGRYTGDGSSTIYYEGKYRRGYASISFGHNEKEEMLKLVEDLKKQGFSARIINCRSEYRVDFGRLGVTESFRSLFGHHKVKRCIPELIFCNADTGVVKEYLRGLIDADGCILTEKYGKHYSMLTTSSRGLALQVQMMCFRINKPTRIVESYRKSGFRKGIVFHVWIREDPLKFKQFLLHDGNILVKVKAVDTVKYVGDVYNMSVEGTETYLVSNAVVHNCGFSPDQKRVRGKPINYSRKLKAHCHRVAAQLLKAGGKFAELYYKLREEESRKKFESPRGAHRMHIHLRALRKVKKEFLKMLWIAWRRSEGLPIRPPYSVEKLGHKSYDPEDFIEK
jgi:intein/homing endonuclease